jgi:ABC-type phosphate/phosphonate transport system substrate-binding protein
MVSLEGMVRLARRVLLAGAVALAPLLAFSGAAVNGQQGKLDVLRIGSSGTLNPSGGKQDEKSSLDTLKAFIKDETGLDSEIERLKTWQELLDKMAKGQLQVGVFQGFEYAYAQEKHPDLKPLAVSVNVYVYPVVYVVTGRDNKAKDFAGLQGQSLALLADSPGYVRLFIDRQCEAAGKKTDAFFSKIETRDNYEVALDDAVDGVVAAAAADRAALDAFKRRKPGRFNKLKPVAQSQPLPPAVVAYYGNHLDEATRKQFRKGLLEAANKEKGQTMLTLFRLTGFQEPPADFEKVLADTRAAYPPKADGKSK